MKFPFLNKKINPSCSYPSSSSWPWPSCHQNPKTLSFRNTTTTESSFPNSSESTLTRLSSAADDDAEAPPSELESIENVIQGLKSSERLIFERKGESNSILEEETKSEVPKRRKGFVLVSLESNDPHSAFKRSMEEMVETHAIRERRSLGKLLSWYLKVNVKSSHVFIFAAFFDLLASLSGENDGVSSSSAVAATVPLAAPCSGRNVVHGESPSSPLSFYTSCSESYSSSDESSSSVRCVSSPEDEKLGVDNGNDNNVKRVCCLSTLLEMEKIKDVDVL